MSIMSKEMEDKKEQNEVSKDENTISEAKISL